MYELLSDSLLAAVHQLALEGRDRDLDVYLHELRTRCLTEAMVALVGIECELGEPEPDPDPQREGERISDRIVLRCHERDGGSGGVYVGTFEDNEGVHHPVAVKFLRIPADPMGEPEVRRRWLDEATHLRELRPSRQVGAHVPYLFESGEYSAGGSRFLYLCMEYKHGANPVRWCIDHALPADARLKLFLDACEAVRMLHRRGLIHGDVKPENFRVEADEGQPRVWILDFGLTGVRGRSWCTNGEIVGTPGYLSLEQLGDRYGPVLEATDVYSLGLVLFEMMEERGWLEFVPHRSAAELERMMREHPAPRVMRVLPQHRRDQINELLAEATALEAADRCPSVTVLQEGVRKILGGESPRRTDPELDIAPYRGLLVFEEANAPWFFGREAALARLLPMLVENRQVLVIGASGCGKSSLLRAGLIPAVRAGALGDGHAWMPLLLRPTQRPVRELALRLANLQSEPSEVSSLEMRILHDPRFLADEIDRLALARPVEPRFLFVVDQLEELFAQCASTIERQAFVAALLELGRDRYCRARVVFGLRADFTDRALEHRGIAEVIQRAAFLLGPMSEAELRSAIEHPAELQRIGLERGLVEQLISAVLGEPGNLPLLQFTLDMLWREREGSYLTWRAYTAMGGIKGAIARYADARLLEAETLGQILPLRRLMGRLVQIGEKGPLTRRSLPIREGLAIHEGIGALLEGWIQARLLTANGDSVELAHETLIREWGTLQAWIAEDCEVLRVQQDLASAARFWRGAGQQTADLWRGARLTRALELSAASELTLAPEEERFLELSRTEVQRLQHEELTRQRRELENAQALATAQRLSARRLRVGLGGTLLLVAGLVVASIIAFDQRNASRRAIEDATTVADFILFTADRDLENVAGANEVRRKLLDAGRELLIKLQTSSGVGRDSEDLLRSSMIQHSQRGDLALSSENLTFALSEYQTSFELAKRLVERNPKDGQYQQDVAVGHLRLGEVAMAEGDLGAAGEMFRESLEIGKQLVDQDARNESYQWDLALSYESLANLEMAERDLDAAREVLDECLRIRSGLVERDPRNESYQRGLSTTYHKLGEVALDEGNLEVAREMLQKDLEISKRLADQDPGNAVDQSRLATTYERLGEVAMAGDLGAATEVLERSLEIRRRLAEQDLRDPINQRALSVTYGKLGDVALGKGDLETASQLYLRGFDIAKRLAEKDWRNAVHQRDLSISYERLGDVAVEKRDFAAAGELFQSAFRIRKRLVEQHPSNATHQRDLFQNMWKGRPFSDGDITWEQIISVMEEMEARGILARADRKFLEQAKRSAQPARSPEALPVASPEN